MKKIKVGITGINAVDNPGPGIGIARSLREDPGLNVEIIGLAYDAMEPGIYMDWIVDRSYMMPYPSGDHRSYCDRLRYIVDNGGMDCIIPALDAELPLYTRYSDQIEDMGIKMLLPTLEQFQLRGKDRLPQLAGVLGINVPETRVINSEDELFIAIEAIGLPVMIKGPLYSAYRAGTIQEAAGLYARVVARWGYPVIVQQVVSGEEMNLVGVGDGNGSSLGMVCIKKMWITPQGKIWTGVTVKNEKMLEAAEAFVRSYLWKGPFELECIVDGDEIYLVEINPRFPAWIYFAAGAGLNIPARMLRTLFSLPVDDNNEYEAGKLFVRYTYEVVTDMVHFQNMTTRGER